MLNPTTLPPVMALTDEQGGLPALLTSGTAITVYIFLILTVIAVLVVAVLVGGREKEEEAPISVEAPNGFTDVVSSGRVTLNYGRSEVPAWNFVNLEDFFGCLERYYGGVPAGEYLVTLSFDGNPACTATFTVNE